MILIAGCEGRHSWLVGAGDEARVIETLFWSFLAGAVVIWVTVIGLALTAFHSEPNEKSRGTARAAIFWGGAIAPTALVATLLVAGLLTLRALASATPALSVHVDGEQWWWRVIYETPEGAVVTANEIRLPHGRTAELVLTSDDVIHSLWAPALGGKMDLIPGRINRMTLTPARIGNWGGLCAEFCGGAHAQMRFDVVVMEPEGFRDWLAAQAQPADPAALAETVGLDVFLDEGCGACHTVRGTEAAGKVGPDLTHLAARERLGAGLVPLQEDTLRRWITAPAAIKPGVEMPGFPDLPAQEMDALVAFLMALE